MISFGANLTINKNIYKNLSETSANFIKKTAKEYSEFLEQPAFKKATAGDTIELYRAKHRGGYALELKIENEKLNEPYITGIYTNKKESEIKTNDLIYETLLYLCHKKGEKPRFTESSIGFIERVLFNGEKVFRRDL